MKILHQGYFSNPLQQAKSVFSTQKMCWGGGSECCFWSLSISFFRVFCINFYAVCSDLYCQQSMQACGYNIQYCIFGILTLNFSKYLLYFSHFRLIFGSDKERASFLVQAETKLFSLRLAKMMEWEWRIFFKILERFFLNLDGMILSH